jgi:integrase
LTGGHRFRARDVGRQLRIERRRQTCRQLHGLSAAGLGDKDLHFHDLRGTAVTRLALSGCTVVEIAAITGHSLRDVESILDAHHLGGQIELAEQAILKLDAKYGRGT